MSTTTYVLHGYARGDDNDTSVLYVTQNETYATAELQASSDPYATVYLWRDEECIGTVRMTSDGLLDYRNGAW